jgi:hypothetical protein
VEIGEVEAKDLVKGDNIPFDVISTNPWSVTPLAHGPRGGPRARGVAVGPRAGPLENTMIFLQIEPSSLPTRQGKYVEVLVQSKNRQGTHLPNLGSHGLL